MRPRVALAFAALLGAAPLAGCASITSDVEGLLTIEEGVYGQLLRGCDTPGCSDSYVPAGDLVGVFDVDPQADREAPPVAMTTVGPRGFYEIALAPGEHWIMKDSGDAPGIQRGVSATHVVLAEGELVRWDWTSGPGGGRWHSR